VETARGRIVEAGKNQTARREEAAAVLRASTESWSDLLEVDITSVWAAVEQAEAATHYILINATYLYNSLRYIKSYATYHTASLPRYRRG
jgi:hypothetical protein